MPLHDARAAADHEAPGRLVGNGLLEHGARMGELPADGQRLVMQALCVPFLDVVIEAVQPVICAIGAI